MLQTESGRVDFVADSQIRAHESEHAAIVAEHQRNRRPKEALRAGGFFSPFFAPLLGLMSTRGFAVGCDLLLSFAAGQPKAAVPT